MDAGPHTYCVARRRTQRGQQQRRGWHSGLNPVFRSKSSCAPLDNRPGFLFLFPRIVCNASPSPINRTDEARAKNRRAEIADPRCAPTGK